MASIEASKRAFVEADADQRRRQRAGRARKGSGGAGQGQGLSGGGEEEAIPRSNIMDSSGSGWWY